jgi:hypothetical protein
MVTIGGDGQKPVPTLVAVEPVGRQVAELTVPHDPAPCAQARAWAQHLEAERTWGIDNRGSVGRG